MCIRKSSFLYLKYGYEGLIGFGSGGGIPLYAKQYMELGGGAYILYDYSEKRLCRWSSAMAVIKLP